MNPVEAISVLVALEKSTSKLTAVTPEENPGLHIHKRLRSNDQVIFVYVDRLELMDFIKKHHNLHHSSRPLNVH